MVPDRHGYPRLVILKNGQEVDFRPMDPQLDEERLFAFFAGIPPSERWYLENDVSDESVVRQYLLCHHPKRMVPIVAVNLGQEIVGKATINLGQGARGHVGKVRLVVTPAYRGQRLGTYLLLDVIHLAVELGLRILVLELVLGVDDEAIRAARKLDFYQQAVLPDFAKDPRGNNYDLAIMIKRLHSGYDDF